MRKLIPTTLVALALLLTSSAAAQSKAGYDGSGESNAAEYEMLRQTQAAFRSVIDTAGPSLVRIETVGGSQPREHRPEPQDGEDPTRRPRSQNPFRETTGSRFAIADGPTTGLVYSTDGYIITGGFNFVREPLLISVTLSDGRRLAADLIARDQVRKIALLKVEAEGLSVPTWRAVDDIRVGQWSIALGQGFGGSTPSVTAGIVSAINRMNGNAIQTDAKLSPANYGGPLCDIHGRVIGLCVPMALRPGELAGIEMYDCGVGFALPKHRIDAIVEVLKTGRSFYRGWLGISIDRRRVDAVVILNVADPSPLREAGIKPGDLILGVESSPVAHFGELVQSLYMIPAGEEVYLHMSRGEREFGIAVKLARSADLGSLPQLEEPFDPSNPIPLPDDD